MYNLSRTNTAIYNLAEARLLVDTDATFAVGATSIAPTSFNNTTGIVNFDHNFTAGTGYYFSLGSINNITTPLPISLLQFSVALNENDEADCMWSTSTETNNDFFTLEKSANGKSWTFVAQVPGMGNSTSFTPYQHTDPQPFDGITYYRLSQTDFNGDQKYLGIKAVKLSRGKWSSIQVYPNPAHTNLTVKSQQKTSGLMTIRSSVGQDVYRTVWTEQSEVIVDVSQFAKGVYFVDCQFGHQNEVIKVVVQ